MIDVLGIATDGYLTKDTFTRGVATRGYLSVYLLAVINVGKPKEAFGYLITDDSRALREKEDEDIMLIIQIFIMRWG